MPVFNYVQVTRIVLTRAQSDSLLYCALLLKAHVSQKPRRKFRAAFKTGFAIVQTFRCFAKFYETLSNRQYERSDRSDLFEGIIR